MGRAEPMLGADLFEGVEESESQAGVAALLRLAQQKSVTCNAVERFLNRSHVRKPEAADEIGGLIRRLGTGLEAVTGCVKTYLRQFSEAEGFSHLHLHLVPRVPDHPEDARAPRVFGYLTEDQLSGFQRPNATPSPSPSAQRLGKSSRHALLRTLVPGPIRREVSRAARILSGVADETTYPPEGLVPYDPNWAERYFALTASFRAHLGPGWEVEHIGSTSVPGLLAKPVVDLAVRLPEGQRLSSHRDALLRAGWSDPVDLGSHDVLFLLDGPVRRAIAHVFTADQWPEAHQRLFASWLREHPSDRDAYARLKKDLYDNGEWGRAYTASKTAFVQDIVDRARAARGLPGVTVWDKG